MTTNTFPEVGHIRIAERLIGDTYLFGLSRGDPAWDAQWAGPNPPTAGVDVTNLVATFGYVRPTLVQYVKPDPSGTVIGTGGNKYSASTTPTRFLHFRLAMPVGSFQGETLREIGLFAAPSIDPAIPPGQVVIPANQVSDPGKLLNVHRRPAYALEDGDFFARSFLLRV